MSWFKNKKRKIEKMPKKDIPEEDWMYKENQLSSKNEEDWMDKEAQLSSTKKGKNYLCRHPTCKLKFYTKEEMLKHYYPKHEGHPYDPEEEQKEIARCKAIKDAESTPEEEYEIYRRRLLRGESEKSARAGLKHLKNK